MAESLITLTTDFGEESAYVAAMKGVILNLHPGARLVDLGHQIPPQNVRHAAFFLADCLPFFPAGTIHLIVVDPGVGTDRALLLVEAAGHYLLAPDNGCWGMAAERLSGSPVVRRLEERRFWRHPVSPTFHGRDILAPVAAHLAAGADPGQFGPCTDRWVRLPFARCRIESGRLSGEVVFVDGFGNLISNIPGAEFRALCRRPIRVRVGRRIITRCATTYAQVPPGTPVALVSSSGWLEVAVSMGHAARVLRARVGSPVVVADSSGNSDESNRENLGQSNDDGP